MGAIVGVDALILISSDNATWTTLPERNEFSINIKVDVAEHKIFVQSLAAAWADKKRTWMSWSGSIGGYMDDTDDTIFDKVVEGNEVFLRFYDSRLGQTQAQVLADADLKYWAGKAVLTSVDHSTGTSDYSTLSVNFEGVGPLTRSAG